MAVRSELSQKYYYLALPLIIIFGFVIAFTWRLPFAVIFFLFGVVPKLDVWLSQDWVNPTR